MTTYNMTKPETKNLIGAALESTTDQFVAHYREEFAQPLQVDLSYRQRIDTMVLIAQSVDTSYKMDFYRASSPQADNIVSFLKSPFFDNSEIRNEDGKIIQSNAGYLSEETKQLMLSVAENSENRTPSGKVSVAKLDKETKEAYKQAVKLYDEAIVSFFGLENQAKSLKQNEFKAIEFLLESSYDFASVVNLPIAQLSFRKLNEVQKIITIWVERATKHFRAQPENEHKLPTSEWLTGYVNNELAQLLKPHKMDVEQFLRKAYDTKTESDMAFEDLRKFCMALKVDMGLKVNGKTKTPPGKKAASPIKLDDGNSLLVAEYGVIKKVSPNGGVKFTGFWDSESPEYPDVLARLGIKDTGSETMGYSSEEIVSHIPENHNGVQFIPHLSVVAYCRDGAIVDLISPDEVESFFAQIEESIKNVRAEMANFEFEDSDVVEDSEVLEDSEADNTELESILNSLDVEDIE